MTTNPPPPLPSFLGATPETDEDLPQGGELVGASDARADAIRSGAGDPGARPFGSPQLQRDSDDVSTGIDDVEADQERSRGQDTDTSEPT